MNPLSPLLCDCYKTSHQEQYPPNTELVYSNWTPRKSRLPGISHVVVFGIQAFIQKYLINDFHDNFFAVPKGVAVARYWKRLKNMLGLDVDTSRIASLHDLGYLPLQIKALPEGSLCPMRVPMMTVVNTDPRFFWVTNMIETLLSCSLWQSMTSATIALEYRKLLTKWAEKTGGDPSFVQWQGHDFSMRGMSSVESACMSGAGHLLSFSGTDTIPAIDFLEEYYGADSDRELVGGSVSATEHSVQSMGTKDGELETYRRLITQIYPKGIVSIVSDTWSLWDVLTKHLPILKDEILARDGKVVIRPDSGDPVDIICGDVMDAAPEEPAFKGVIELLWDVFGGTVNEKEFKVLDPHIGAIYGDSITLERANAICERLAAKGFASTNIVFGIGSYTYQYNTRDTFGFAMKSTYGEVDGRGIEIWKDPVTDDGTKKSAKGLLRVEIGESGDYELLDQQTWDQEKEGELKLVFLDGDSYGFQTLAEIRERVATQFS